MRVIVHYTALADTEQPVARNITVELDEDTDESVDAAVKEDLAAYIAANRDDVVGEGDYEVVEHRKSEYRTTGEKGA